MHIWPPNKPWHNCFRRNAGCEKREEGGRGAGRGNREEGRRGQGEGRGKKEGGGREREDPADLRVRGKAGGSGEMRLIAINTCISRSSQTELQLPAHLHTLPIVLFPW